MGECDLGEVARSAHCLCHEAHFLGLTPKVSLKFDPRQASLQFNLHKRQNPGFSFPHSWFCNWLETAGHKPFKIFSKLIHQL